jgi:dephospho-CoA kinase
VLEVGLTGGIASGKSTVAAMFVELGASLIDADRLARRAVEPGSPALAEIEREFGPRAVGPDGGLDRAFVRARVFSDQAARARLNAIVHPRVNELMMAEKAARERDNPRGVLLVDIPLLYETGWDKRFETVVVVYVPREVQIGRLMTRDKVGREQAEQALCAQMPLEQKRSRANFVVDNSGSMEETREKVAVVWAHLVDMTVKDHAG